MNYYKSMFHSPVINLSKLNQEPFLDSVVFFPVHFFLVPFGHMTRDVSLVS